VTALTDLRTDMTQRLILQAGLRTLEEDAAAELTMRAVAKASGISERTMFRYFATRDDLLDALAAELVRTLALQPHPRTIDDLVAMPAALYRSFEEKRNLMRASLQSELSNHIRATFAKERWIAVGKLIDAFAPRAPEPRRKIASANIRFYLSGSTWHYYRFIFRFTLEDTIACAEAAIRQSLDSLR
jgi:AcrR family transcriptional regulator